MFHHVRHDMMNFLRVCTIVVVTCLFFGGFVSHTSKKKCEDLFEQKKIRATNLVVAPMFVHIGLVLV